eukprot:TRINITY_DN1157_c0_g1_i1.p5 TRINITY_DN1157_c0_g1~~TRINITY_DN1157_c0_g1_i1.p5  ORF type:complete len:101 (+),score=19.73 TRINITY_DN1157_c0_g1_i1:595-897(+)
MGHGTWHHAWDAHAWDAWDTASCLGWMGLGIMLGMHGTWHHAWDAWDMASCLGRMGHGTWHHAWDAWDMASWTFGAWVMLGAYRTLLVVHGDIAAGEHRV